MPSAITLALAVLTDAESTDLMPSEIVPVAVKLLKESLPFGCDGEGCSHVLDYLASEELRVDTIRAFRGDDHGIAEHAEALRQAGKNLIALAADLGAAQVSS